MPQVRVIGSIDLWRACAGSQEIGSLRAVIRPDRRCFVQFEDCRDDAYGPLLTAAIAELAHDLHTEVDQQDARACENLSALGFMIERHERLYRVPTDPARLRIGEPRPPAGTEIISAAEADLDRLRELDDRLRQDIPGCQGWRWDADEFRQQTFGGTDFDPQTYLVAVDRGSGGYAGLLRVWMGRAGPRLGCLAVLPGHRRTRLVHALVGRVARTLHERGHPEVLMEIDSANRAANAMLARRPADRAGGIYVLLRRHHHGLHPETGS